MIVISIGAIAVKTTGYKDVDSLASVKEITAVTVQGKVVDIKVDFQRNVIVFTLEGESGYKVLAQYPLDRFQAEYGGLPSHSTVESKIVVSGTFYPGGVGNVVGTIEVKSILTGCHKAYEVPQVKRT